MDQFPEKPAFVVKTKPIHSAETLSKFHVITVISNPVRYRSRYRLYREFEKHMRASGANLWTVEAQFGDREFCVTEPDDPKDIRFRHWTEFFLKECLINAALARLPGDWEKVAWVDADIMFHRSDWVPETIHLLEHYMFIQMFSHAIDLGPSFEPLQTHTGFVKAYMDGGMKAPPFVEDYYGGGLKGRGAFAHTGFCWAARREAIDAVGGLIDHAILGSADHQMARALVGDLERSFHTQFGAFTSRYLKKMVLWQERAEKFIQRDIGYMPGTISHYWHGSKKNRRYVDRTKILVDNEFDPDLDLKRDSQGLYQLTDRNFRLRDDLRAYLRARNEDSIDL